MPTPALRDLQAAMREALLAGDGTASAGLLGLIAGDGLEPAARLAIYRHHVGDTLAAALRATYPVVCRLVHERFFAYAASRFIRDHPPAGPCLHEYGAAFAAFLETFPPCRELPYLPDVARLEWALGLAAHAGDAVAIDPALLAGLPVEEAARASFQLHPSMSLLCSPWPVHEIWRANQPDADPATEVDLAGGEVHLEVRRRGDTVTFRALDRAGFSFRRVLAGGGALEDAAAAALTGDGGFDLVAALRELLADGLLVGFTLPPSGEAAPVPRAIRLP
jgi:hypothetical protein